MFLCDEVLMFSCNFHTCDNYAEKQIAFSFYSSVIAFAIC